MTMKLNASSGTSDSTVVNTSAVARMLMSPAARSRITA